MKPCQLCCQFTDDHVQFSVARGEDMLPVEEWRSYEVRDKTGVLFSCNMLEQLCNKGWATLTENTVTILNQHMAKCLPWELAALALPPALPFHLRIHPRGSLTMGSKFAVEYAFHALSRPISFTRTGIMVKAEGKGYCLLDPNYSIVTKIDAYRTDPLTDPQDRMPWWADLLDLVADPDEVIENKALRSYKIARAYHFTVSIQSIRGDLRITPRLLAEVPTHENEDGSTLENKILPPQAHAIFVKNFEQLPLRTQYSLGGGYFISLPKEMQAGLSAVKAVNRASIQEKIDFINNPYEFLKEHLAGDLSEEIIDSIFVETPLFLEERVKGLCIWEARNVFPTSSSGQKWLPDTLPDTVQVVVGDKAYHVSVPELRQFIADVAGALESNELLVSLCGDTISVRFDLLEQLKTTARIFWEEEKQEKVEILRIAPKVTDVDEEYAMPTRSAWEGAIEYAAGMHPHLHQQDGIAWLQAHWRAGTSGALLADDMGLGKTLQTLSFMWWLLKQMETGHAERHPILIVAPTALIKNWQEEAEKFFEGALGKPLEAYGSFFTAFAGSRAAAREALMQYSWVITTYETMRDKIEVFVGPYSLLVFDEAQKIKNPGALVSEMAKSIKTEFCLALTGTPVENSLRDLVSIVDRVQPTRKQKLLRFVENYEAIERGGKPTFGPYPEEAQCDKTSCDASAGQQDEAEETYDKETFLQKIKEELECATPPVLLRRLKDTHWNERPEKTIYPPYEDIMPPLQAQIYDAALAKAKEKLRMGSMGAVLEAIQRMRQISLHPPLDPTDSPKKMLECSARIARLMTILDEIQTRGEKALVFVEYLDTQARLATLLSDRYSLSVSCINGGVQATQRQGIVNRFQNGTDEFDVLLLSPKAGGVGLNLTAANHVIHLTRWWNPAVEDQCTDRVYRIGQKKPVFLHYPLAIHPTYGDQSFDCNLHRLLDKKRALSQGLLSPTNPVNSREELEALLGNA